jgi:hypothetical protein
MGTTRTFRKNLRAHLELEADRLREPGFSDKDARTMAHRNAGNIMNIEQRFYQAGRWMWLDNLWQDLCLASRQMRKNKAFTVVLRSDVGARHWREPPFAASTNAVSVRRAGVSAMTPTFTANLSPATTSQCLESRLTQAGRYNQR